MAGPGSDKAGHRASCVRFSSDDRAGNRPAKPSGLGMVSMLQHIAGCATDARQRPGAARFIAGPELRRRADRRRGRPRGPGHVEHEKNTFFS